jgi:hypothetical protein
MKGFAYGDPIHNGKGNVEVMTLEPPGDKNTGGWRGSRSLREEEQLELLYGNKLR